MWLGGALAPPPASSSRGRRVALGDSISIDLYPFRDIEERGLLHRPPQGVGAASLLHRNEDRLWPAFEGIDLARLIGEAAKCVSSDRRGARPGRRSRSGRARAIGP